MTTTSSSSPMRPQLQKYAAGLSSFTNSTSTFRILHSLPPNPIPPLPPPKTLYILDSSFNPPTLAHLHIARTALTADAHCGPSTPKRLLLLLATQNADKAPKPASFPQRLVMMELFAQELLSSLSHKPSTTSSNSSIAPAPAPAVGIDIGVTTQPYFTDKAASIASSGAYASSPEQVHLTGFDTLIRILDPKYYPPEHNLRSLGPFLDKHRLRVSYRKGDRWGGRERQDEYLRELGEGRREVEGGRREWVDRGRIELVDGREEGTEVVSSTRVREACRNGDGEALRRLVTSGVAEFVTEERLYLED